MIIYAELMCGHVKIVRTKDGREWAQEFCKWCDKWSDVRAYYSEEWHVVCRSCKFRSHHGVVKVYAEQSAARHTRLTGHHDVGLLWYSSAPKDVRDKIPEPEAQDQLPIQLPNVPPF